MPALLTRMDTAPNSLGDRVDQRLDGGTVGDVERAADAAQLGHGSPMACRAALGGGRADHGRALAASRSAIAAPMPGWRR